MLIPGLSCQQGSTGGFAGQGGTRASVFLDQVVAQPVGFSSVGGETAQRGCKAVGKTSESKQKVIAITGWQCFYLPRSSRLFLSIGETLASARHLDGLSTQAKPGCIQRGRGAEFKDSPPSPRAGDLDE